MGNPSYGQRFRNFYTRGEYSNFVYGGKFSVTLGGIDFNNLQLPVRPGKNHLQVGVDLGGFCEYKIADYMRIRPEVFYAYRSGKVTFSGGSYAYHLSYVNVPILYDYKVENGFEAFAGPSFDINASAKFIDIETKNGLVAPQTLDYSPYIKKFAISGVIGGGYALSTVLSIDARVSANLTNLATPTNPHNGFNIYSLQIGIRYLFYTGKNAELFRY